MKITFISPYPDVTSFGIRTMSAYMRQHRHSTQIIFLPDPYGDNLMYGVKRYDDKVLSELTALCADTDLIGITLMTNFFDNAVQITEKLKRDMSIPVIWGGVHPTIRPDESIEYADMICIGDGEDALLELADKMDKGADFLTTRNFWIKSNGRVYKNPLRELTKSLDSYPIPDYSNEGHYVLYEGSIKPLTQDLLRPLLERGTVSAYLRKIGYQTMTGRGCPHRCTYCINDTIKGLYEGQGYLRWRSVDHVMEELQWVKENMPYVGYIWISDDAFFARNLKNLETFCREYKGKIGLPFSCLGSPLTVNDEKMEMLVDAGLIYLQLGIESGSRSIQELFNRKNMSNEVMMKAIRTINKYKGRMFPPSYDFILDVPYETESDKIESLRFIADIPKPFRLQPFSLVLYPGTRLYQMAKSDGMIGDDRREIYSKSYTMREPSYLNLLMAMAKGGRFPGPLLKFLVSGPVVNVLNSAAMKPFFKHFYILLKKAYTILKRVLGRQ
ncbi:MAG: radical SAM protein [Nitrospirota bacterium]